ncbi:MAG: VTT domain-containing protein [Thermodesulfobacteriota bacterium]
MRRPKGGTVGWLLLLGLTGSAILAFLLLGHDALFDSAGHLRNRLDPEALREKFLGFGFLAPLVFMGLQAFQVLAAPFPGEATGILGGYLFGVWPSFFYSTLGLTAGSMIAFAVGHFFGHLLLPWFERSDHYRRFNKLIRKGDFVIPFILFLIPGLPKDFLSYVLGLTTMPSRVFLFITGVARMPGTMMLCLQGARVYEGNWQAVAGLLALTVLVSLPSYLFRHQLVLWLARMNNGHLGNGLKRP